jgi:hypothetical protein
VRRPALAVEVRRPPLAIPRAAVNAQATYQRNPHAPLSRAHSLVVLTLDADRISQITRFGDMSVLARFGLPRTLDDPSP